MTAAQTKDHIGTTATVRGRTVKAHGASKRKYAQPAQDPEDRFTAWTQECAAPPFPDHGFP